MSSTEFDCDARLPDITDDARVVAVVAAVGGEIERDRQPHLTGREIIAIEAVRTLSAVEKPEYCRIVHGRLAYIVARGPRR